MEDDKLEFKSASELYQRVEPALYSKLKEMNKLGFKYVTEKDIWNYLAENVWKKKVNLELHELISDILYADNYLINNYVMKKMDNLKKNDADMNEIKTLGDDVK
jgi:hypothetical protein